MDRDLEEMKRGASRTEVGGRLDSDIGNEALDGDMVAPRGGGDIPLPTPEASGADLEEHFEDMRLRLEGHGFSIDSFCAHGAEPWISARTPGGYLATIEFSAKAVNTEMSPEARRSVPYDDRRRLRLALEAAGCSIQSGAGILGRGVLQVVSPEGHPFQVTIITTAQDPADVAWEDPEVDYDKGTLLEGVRDADGLTPRIAMNASGREVVRVFTEAGFVETEVDLLDLVEWLKVNRPELLAPENADIPVQPVDPKLFSQEWSERFGILDTEAPRASAEPMDEVSTALFNRFHAK